MQRRADFSAARAIWLALLPLYRLRAERRAYRRAAYTAA
jgi:hypothetical protein